MPLFLLFLLSGTAVPLDTPMTDRAWTDLKQGISETKAAKRMKAVHALGLAGRPTQSMAEKTFSDPDKEVRSETAFGAARNECSYSEAQAPRMFEGSASAGCNVLRQHSL